MSASPGTGGGLPAAHTDDEEQQGLLHGSRASSAPPPALQRLLDAFWGSGAASICTAAACFSLAASLVKVVEKLDPRVTVFQIIVTRSFLAIAASLVTARAKGISPVYGQLRHWPLLGMRGLAGAASMTVFYMSVLRLPLADSITILFCNPAICAILGWVLLRERFGWLTAVGCLASLVGVIMVAQPPFLLQLLSAAPQPPLEWTQRRMVGMVLGVSGAVLAAVAYVTIRVIGKREQSLTIALWFHSISGVSSAIPLALSIPQPAVFPPALAWLALLGIAVCSFCAQLFLNRGFQLELAARAAAFNYTQVIWANLLGVMFFHEPLTLLGVLGAVLILVGVLTVSADKKKAAAAADAQPGDEHRLKAKNSCQLEDQSPGTHAETGAASQGSIGPPPAGPRLLGGTSGGSVGFAQLELLPAERHRGGTSAGHLPLPS